MSYAFHFDVFRFYHHCDVSLLTGEKMYVDKFHNYAFISTFSFKPLKNSPGKYVFRKT